MDNSFNLSMNVLHIFFRVWTSGLTAFAVKSFGHYCSVIDNCILNTNWKMLSQTFYSLHTWWKFNKIKSSSDEWASSLFYFLFVFSKKCMAHLHVPTSPSPIVWYDIDKTLMVYIGIICPLFSLLNILQDLKQQASTAVLYTNR